MNAGRARLATTGRRAAFRAVLVTAIAVLGFLVVLVASSSGPVDVGRVPPPAPPAVPSDSTDESGEAEQTDVPQGAPGVFEVPNNDLVAAIVGLVLIVLLVSFVRALIATLSDLVRFLRRRSRAPEHGMVVLPDVDRGGVVLDVDGQLSALAVGGPRNAIVACWLRMEEDVAVAGFPRRPSETSAEFTERVLGSLSIDPVPIGELAALYREARFSAHPMEQADRELALDALRRVHAALAPTVGVDG